MTIETHVQRADQGAKVTLYHIDLSMFGEADLFFTPGTDGAQAVEFGGETYSPHPVKADGFEIVTSGSLPRPRLTVANISGIFTPLIEEHDDLIGAVLTRTLTYERYLDNGPDPDPEATEPPDVYEFSRKLDDDGVQVTWELTALMDQEGVTLPGRRVTRDYCPYQYRRWTGAAFDYTDVECPYTGAQSYDLDGNPVASALDRPSKRLGTCCEVRFGENAVLPFGGFPGASRLRVRA